MNIEALEKGKKFIEDILNDLYFEKKLTDDFSNDREIAFLTDNKKHLELCDKRFSEYTKKTRDIYLLKICMGYDKHNLETKYIYQPIKKVLEYFQEKDLYYYSKLKIEDVLKENIPVILTDVKEIKKLEEADQILSFYVGENIKYVYLYKKTITSYVNEKIKTKLMFYHDTYDNSEYINFKLPEDLDKNYILGDYINLY